MKRSEKAQLLFSILYLAAKPVKLSNLLPIFNIQSPIEIVLAQNLIQKLNEDLESRSAPYEVIWSGIGSIENSILELILKPEYRSQLTFSNYFVKQEKLSRDKIKILSYIAYQNHLKHESISLEGLIDILENSGFEKYNISKLLTELEKDGLLFKKRGKGSSNTTKIALSMRFFDLMGLPKDKISLGPALREELLKVLEGEIIVEDDEITEV
jgi:chromosome segregation and condensation protein ScpB